MMSIVNNRICSMTLQSAKVKSVEDALARVERAHLANDRTSLPVAALAPAAALPASHRILGTER
jgi:hypothetical protein